LGAAWEAKLSDDIKCAVEKRIRELEQQGTAVEKKYTRIDVKVSPDGSATFTPTPRGTHYAQLAEQVLREFGSSGRLRPTDGQPHNVTLVLGVEESSYPQPQQPQTPAVSMLYGSAWRIPAGQRTRFPIDIEVPSNLPRNVYKEGNLRAGLQGQYSAKFGGRVLRQWRPAQPGRAEVPGSFRIETLYTADGATEQHVNITVPLVSTPPSN